MKSLLPSREQIPAIITLIIVMLLACVYYFVYLPGNEQDIRKWKFRTLKNVDTNIREKITNGNSLLSTYLKRDSILTYINSINKTVADKRIRSIYFADSLHKFNKSIIKLKSKEFPIDTIRKITNNVQFEPLIYINNGEQLVVVRKDTIGDSTFEISLTYNFDSFIEPLLPKDVFDEYLVLGNNTVLYESASLHSGLDYSNDSLLTNQNDIKGSLIKDRTFGGNDYKLFIQPVICDSNTKLFVIGLLSREHYQQGKTKLPSRIILLLITVFTTILISFPIIKLYQLGNEDRLTVTDGILVTLVSMILVSLLFFIFVKYNSILFKHPTDPKEAIADNISQDFLDEIKNDRRKLRQLDSLMARDNISGSVQSIDSSYRTDFFDIDKEPTKNINAKKTRRNTINSLSNMIDLDRIFWLDSLGAEKYAWKSGPKKVTFHGNFKDRTYFKKVINGQAWDSDSVSVFYVEQVISWIDGVFITLISIPSKVQNVKVAVLSFFVKSLSDIKLPFGYTFAMVDKEGKVLYHSKKTKNLKENLLEEFSESAKLSICLRTGSSEHFNTDYFGKEYQVFVKPIGGGLPYYLVILDSLSFVDSRDIDVYSFTFSMQFSLFILVIIQMLIVFFSSAKRSVYQDQVFDTTWLGPKESSNREYVVAARFNFYIFFALCLFPFESVLCRLFILLFAVSILPIFLNLLFVKKYKSIDSFRRYKLNAVRSAGIIPVLINIIASVILNETLIRFFIFEFICLLPAIITLYGVRIRNFVIRRLSFSLKRRIITNSNFLLKSRQIIYNTKFWNVFILYYNRLLISVKKIFPSFFRKSNFSRSFTTLVFSWFIVTCGLPILIFFTASYNYDQHLIARTKQFSLATNLIDDLNVREAMKGNPRIKKEIIMDTLSHSFYCDSYWANESGISRAPNETDLAEDEMSINILDRFRIYDSQDISNRKDLSRTRAFDFSFFFSNLIKQVSSKSDKTVTYVRLNNKTDYFWISSSPLNFSLPSLSSLGGLLCWIALLFALSVTYKLFQSIINKLFSLNIPDVTNWHLLDKEILLDKFSNNPLFIIGLPYSGQKELVEKIYAGKNICKIDLGLIPMKDKDSDILLKWNKLSVSESMKSYDLIIINHLEYNFKDPYMNNVKLRILETLLLEANKFRVKMIILSAIHSTTLLAAITESNAKETEKQSIERWQDLLGNFRILVHRLSQFKRKISLAPNSVILNEIQNTKFLNDMSRPILKTFGDINRDNNNEETEESLIFKLQTTSYHYYFSIWQSLSKEEKFLLYDLAEDGLMNAFDTTTLCLLLDKGIIIRLDGRLKLFNRGFRHFILTGIGTAETVDIMEKINDNRNWNKIKIPLALISITILTILLSSQRETSTKLITSIGALAAVIPALINFLSSLGSGSAQKK